MMPDWKPFYRNKFDDNLPPWLSQEELEARDEELTEDDFDDIGDDSDEYESLEARLEPLLENLQ